MCGGKGYDFSAVLVINGRGFCTLALIFLRRGYFLIDHYRWKINKGSSQIMSTAI